MLEIPVCLKKYKSPIQSFNLTMIWIGCIEDHQRLPSSWNQRLRVRGGCSKADIILSMPLLPTMTLLSTTMLIMKAEIVRVQSPTYQATTAASSPIVSPPSQGRCYIFKQPYSYSIIFLCWILYLVFADPAPMK